MAFPRKKVEALITGLEDPLNVDLIKLLGLAAPEPLRAYWRTEIRSWLRKIARLRIKPNSEPASAEDLFAWLFDEPYGEVDPATIEALLEIEGQGFVHGAAPAAEIADRLRACHQALAPRLAAGDPAVDLIDGLTSDAWTSVRPAGSAGRSGAAVAHCAKTSHRRSRPCPR